MGESCHLGLLPCKALQMEKQGRYSPAQGVTAKRSKRKGEEAPRGGEKGKVSAWMATFIWKAQKTQPGRGLEHSGFYPSHTIPSLAAGFIFRVRPTPRQLPPRWWELVGRAQQDLTQLNAPGSLESRAQAD